MLVLIYERLRTLGGGGGGGGIRAGVIPSQTIDVVIKCSALIDR